MAQISTKKTGIKKQLRNLKRQEEQRREAKRKLKPIGKFLYTVVLYYIILDCYQSLVIKCSYAVIKQGGIGVGVEGYVDLL